eukprot:7388198-Prymnesium_polylepis.1
MAKTTAAARRAKTPTTKGSKGSRSRLRPPGAQQLKPVPLGELNGSARASKLQGNVGTAEIGDAAGALAGMRA